jgi:hypothetical protein
VALTLREVCGLRTEEIAHAFLTPAPTLAQRIVRAKSKIRDAKIPYEVPEGEELAERLEAVLRVIYLVFNEGYSASSGEAVTRADLSGEAIRIARLLVQLLPEPEAVGLLALILLQDSRRAARTSPTGDIVLLEEQDRSLWNREGIAEGVALVESALASRRFGPYAIQAAIAAVHAEAQDGGRHRLATNRGPLRRAPRAASVARRRAEPRRGDRHARWPRRGSNLGGCDPRARRARAIPSRPRGPGRSLPEAGRRRRRRRSYEKAWRSPSRRPSGASSSGGSRAFLRLKHRGHRGQTREPRESDAIHPGYCSRRHESSASVLPSASSVFLL